jgi:membrane dipeptidase
VRIVDAHEDIAWNAVVLGRDVRRSAQETRRLELGSDIPLKNGRCMVGLPEWLAGGVMLVCGSVFVSPPRRPTPDSFDASEYAAMRRQAQAQIDYYHTLAKESDRIALVVDRPGLDRVLDTWDSDEPQVGIIPSMEGADPLSDAADVEIWYEKGIRLLSLSWRAGSRFAGGDGVPGPLTDVGRELLEVMAELGIVLDVSHLAEEAFFETVDRYEGHVVATHANPRVRVPGRRQLSDAMIRVLAEREGVIGIVPYNRFLKRGWSRGDPKDVVTVADVAAAVDTVCQIMGHAEGVGLGSDFDGGFGSESAPLEIDTIAELGSVGAALGEMGYGDDVIRGVLYGNWLRVLRAGLPE